MLRHEKSAPIWLFSFVDLAFLLLIAFTQIGPERGLVVQEIELPRIQSKTSGAAPTRADPQWQLRIHPAYANATPEATPDAEADRAENEAPTPFQLVELNPATHVDSPETTSDGTVGKAIDARELEAHLQVIAGRRYDRPLLAPHRDARAEDLLVAVAMIEDIWQGQRIVAVLPNQSVSAGRNAAKTR